MAVYIAAAAAAVVVIITNAQMYMYGVAASSQAPVVEKDAHSRHGTRHNVYSYGRTICIHRLYYFYSGPGGIPVPFDVPNATGYPVAFVVP